MILLANFLTIITPFLMIAMFAIVMGGFWIASRNLHLPSTLEVKQIEEGGEGLYRSVKYIDVGNMSLKEI
jgi:hypothetical protein